MTEFLETSWPILLVALLLLVALAWYIFHARRTTRVAADRRDVLDEGAERARRNQALLDAPPRPVTPAATSAAAPEPRVTASLPVAGAVGGAETAAGSLGGMSAAIAASEQAERDESLGKAASGVPDSSSPVGLGSGADHGDLTRLKGVGPKLAQQLRELGVERIDQIAAWTEADIERVDAALGRFQGRILRDDWVGQARLLESGDRAAYESRFGRLDRPGT